MDFGPVLPFADADEEAEEAEAEEEEEEEEENRRSKIALAVKTSKRTKPSGSLMSNRKKNDSFFLRELLKEIPESQMYERSYMHRAEISHVIECSNNRADFFCSASRDGHVKFWRKQARGIEFAKHFRAHKGRVIGMAKSACGTRMCTIGEDLSLKVFDVVNFDMIGMVKLSESSECTCACWLFDGRRKGTSSRELVAVGDRRGKIRVFDVAATTSGDNDSKGGDNRTQEVCEKLEYHQDGFEICAMEYNEEFACVVSTDSSGAIEIWSADFSSSSSSDEETKPFERLPSNNNKNGFLKFSRKIETDLYALEKAKTNATNIQFSKDGKKMVICARDSRIRVFNFLTCKLKVTFNEDLSAAEDAQRSGNEKYVLEDIDFGRRFAAEKSIDEKLLDNYEYPNAIFDESGNFLIYANLLGIKVVNLTTLVCSRLLGKVENAERFTKIALFQGAAKRDSSLKGSGKDYSVQADGTSVNDPTIMACAVGSQRVYLFSNREPEDNDDDTEGKGRDVFNEKPTTIENNNTRNGSNGGGGGLLALGGGGADKNSRRLPTSATLHTNIGDIIFKLFPKECPKTVENFTTHCRNGYYDDVIFHRVIKGFMVQTGDPLGDGTGGTSIWGSEFEDEINRDLRHDRAGVLSSANAGPNTNGSQFFVTTVPTPWLDGKHSVFGRVAKGMDIVTKIENLKVDKSDRPLEDVKIVSASVSFD
mgnify:CR=1 FL=1